MERTGATLHVSFRRALEANDLHAWEEFVREAHGVVASTVFNTLARRRSPQKDQVEDLVQETFLKLCAHNFSLMRRFRSDNPGALVAYIRTIAATVVADALRSRAAQKRGAGGEPLNMDDIRDGIGSTESIRTLERDILLGQVGECLSGEKTRDRQVFWLYYRQGLTSRAIAAIKLVDLTSSGVDSLIRRLTITVQKCLNVPSGPKIQQSAKGKTA